MIPPPPRSTLFPYTTLFRSERQPEYVDRLARLVAAGRIEIVGGPFYEPILTMIPSRDRVGQITAYSDWLQSRLGAKVDRKSTRLNSSHRCISYAVFCLKKKI